ncbi:hypothetical protein Mal15_50270 [Stieleria maiorica]|uniref:Tetratricopeptide repeat protein n=1 Tax=Stieleria maiorica TaxID=2795974 RepID=A0A5B9MLR8_9BACT|nr:hypothetical protein [Stieleria maiorica]QEG00951.1 hypothetical protein Mal15_50270 [Stieleria maiorica]
MTERRPAFCTTATTASTLCLAICLLAVSGCDSHSDTPTEGEDQIRRGQTVRAGDDSTAPLDDTLIGTVKSRPGTPAGSQACVECHQDRYETYMQTAHSRSLRPVDLEAIRTDVAMDHQRSKRSYEIINRSGELWHREWLHFRAQDAPNQDSDPKLRTAEMPVEFVMGSGTFAEAYVLRDGGYLLQSPVTWYTADQAYAMAPGYDEQVHRGCNRVVETHCLFCHVGNLSREQPQHPKITELAIGCRRCHGPGERHVQYHRSHAESPDAEAPPDDARLIDPTALSRSKLESICAQCHLNGDVVVETFGNDIWDFVPGNEFAETRLVYHAEDGRADDPFAQHFDQMWQSICYQESETLTCATCHDPHHAEPATDRATLHRDHCNRCHNHQACGVPLDQRKAENDNQCVLCHMPSRPSDAVHSATTNHRIAVYSSSPPNEAPPANAPVTLRRVQPLPPGISPEQAATADRLAEAYWLLENNGDTTKTRGLDAGSIEASLLESSDASAPHVLSALARLADLQSESAADASQAIRHSERGQSYADRALADPSIGHRARVGALEVLANHQYRAAEYEAAVETYQRLVTLRRSAVDHYNLGLALGKIRRFGPAEQAFREATRIDPSYPLPYQSLSVLYRGINPQLSAQMERLSRSLIQNAR